jgi:outer membrane protein OmpA-like peptidoglycan-associated protein
MKTASLLLAALYALASLPALAQNERMFRDGNIDESALVDALTPQSGQRTRSIRVAPEKRAEETVPQRASASLLITFETNSARLTPRARQSLDIVGNALNSTRLENYKFAIEGHSDPRGNHEANLKLSQARAQSVANYLIMQKNIDRNRLEPVGKGDAELANRANPAAPENRRVTIVNTSE